MANNFDTLQVKRKITPPERFFSRSPHSIVTMVVRIRGSVSGEMLKSALEKVQKRHELLRMRIIEDDAHVQWFTPEGAGDIPVDVVARSSDQDWIEFHAEKLKEPFEFDRRPAIRLLLVQSQEISELVILCHHIICDGMSLAYLARDLMLHLGDPAREAEVLPRPAVIELENLPQGVSQSSIAKFFIRRMNKKWLDDSQYFDQQDYIELTRAYWDSFDHRFIPIEFTEEETLALVARCREEETTVNSALTAAFCGAQRIVEGDQPYHPKVVVAADLRERLPRSPGEGMGMYAGGAELKFSYNPRFSFWDNARDFHRAIQPKYTDKNLFSNINNWLYLEPTILDAIPFKELGGLVSAQSSRYAKLSAFGDKPDVILRILKQDNLDSLDTKLWGTAVTNLGRLDFPTIYGPLELDRLILQPGGGFPLANVNLVIGAVTCSGRMSLVVEYAEQAIDSGTVGKINDQALEFLSGK